MTTRSLMVADLSVEDAIHLQEQGIGEGRSMGCGLFIPQKSF
ncbi:MAG: type I-MYXAN CRISPR-associated protein Cas6/Cmx6 [Sedimenticola sp.]